MAATEEAKAEFEVEIPEYALEIAAGRNNVELKRQSTVLAVGWLLTWMALRLYTLPVRLLLKNHLHTTASGIAGFMFLTGFAWYLKPVAGLISDSIPILGTRRKHYLMFSSLLGGASWLALAVLPQTYTNLLVGIIIMNATIMVCSTVLGGLIVEVGKRFKATGRLTGHRTAMDNLSGLIAGPAAGFLASRAFGLTAGISAALMFALVPFAIFYLREPATARFDSEVWRTAGNQLKVLVKSGPLWAAIGMNILLYISPGFVTPLLIWQTDRLHFSDQFIGNLGLFAGAAGFVGALIYVRACRSISLRTTMYLAVITGAIGSFCYLGYYSHSAAILIESVNGLLSAVATLAVFDLSARAAPKGGEAMAYSLMMAAANLAIGLSDVFGSGMHDKWHWSFMRLVWFNGGTTLLILFVVPFLPKSLVEGKDGDPGDSAELVAAA